jgi:hypothetical protein
VGGPTLIVLSWPRAKRPNSSARRWLCSTSLPGFMWFDSLEALIGWRCLLSRDRGGGGRRGVKVEGGSGLEIYTFC